MPAIPLATADTAIAALQPEVLFSDIDGTLVGRSGSLFARFDGTPTIAAAEALFAAHQAGLTIVLVSGRPKAKVTEVGRLLGIRDAITELGTVLIIDGDTELLWGEVPRGEGATPAETFERTGTLGWLLDRYHGRLEPHEPLPQGRQGTILLRGQLLLEEANAALAANGFGWAQLVDNGRFNRPFSHLGPERTHAYHLAPTGATKAAAARVYLDRQGLRPSQAAAIGDAPSDLELIESVQVQFMVANGAWAIRDEDSRPIVVTQGSAGQGWAEAVTALLARREAATNDG